MNKMEFLTAFPLGANLTGRAVGSIYFSLDVDCQGGSWAVHSAAADLSVSTVSSVKLCRFRKYFFFD